MFENFFVADIILYNLSIYRFHSSYIFHVVLNAAQVMNRAHDLLKGHRSRFCRNTYL